MEIKGNTRNNVDQQKHVHHYFYIYARKLKPEESTEHVETAMTIDMPHPVFHSLPFPQLVSSAPETGMPWLPNEPRGGTLGKTLCVGYPALSPHPFSSSCVSACGTTWLNWDMMRYYKLSEAFQHNYILSLLVISFWWLVGVYIYSELVSGRAVC